MRVALLLLLGACSTQGSKLDQARPPHATRATETHIELTVTRDTWTSAWERAPFEFDELLPSWNVQLPEGAAFRVDLELDQGPGTQASGWLDLGGRGAWPAAELSTTEAGFALVDIDLVKLTQRATRVRWRIRARTTAQPVRIKRLALCFTDTRAIPATITSSLRPPGIDIRLRLRRQFDESPTLGPRICSPTSVAMVLEHHGVNLPTSEVAAQLYDEQHDLYGNWNRAVQGAFELGLPGYLTRLASWPEAAAHLESDRPLIISIGVKPGQLTGAPYPATPGHLIVLAGFDGAGRAKVYDPAVRAPDQAPRWYTLHELETVWLARGGFAYVISPR